jgi:hypothetical protein
VTRFRPSDPEAVHARFERIKARTLRRMDEEERELWRRLEALEISDDDDEGVVGRPTFPFRRRGRRPGQPEPGGR